MAEQEGSRAESSGGTEPEESTGTQGPGEGARVEGEVDGERAPEEVSELESISSQMAYESYLSAAKAIEPEAIEECCTDVVLAYVNVTRGVSAVVGGGALLLGKLPGVNVAELSMLPRLAQGLAHAALKVQQELRSESFGTLFERAQLLRRQMRRAADALAEANLLADADVDELRLEARRDVLEDCQALVALFRRNEARISGRSPVGPAELREAELLTAKLWAMLGQQGAGEEGGPSLLDIIQMRDRFWTLLNQRYDVLWRCGAWIYGREVDERIPPLPLGQARVRKPRVTPRAASEPRRTMNPPSIVPVRAPAPSRPASPMPMRDTSRHMRELQNEMERKTRFLVRFGVIPPQS